MEECKIVYHITLMIDDAFSCQVKTLFDEQRTWRVGNGDAIVEVDILSSKSMGSITIDLCMQVQQICI